MRSRELFTGLDLGRAPGDVVGLVGPNGSGKSTAAAHPRRAARARRRQRDGGAADRTLGYLAQEPERLPGETRAR
jgi:ATPase subunit of ABC transporter with duplicated ATPase domains